MELIRIEERNGQQVVSARELHRFLGVNTDFTNWCKRMFDYGFTEDQDYCLLAKNGEQKRGGHNATDYALTIDAAKEIAMLQRSEKGKQARQYFIECERKLKQPMDILDLMVHSANQLREQARRMEQIESSVRQIEAKVTSVNTEFYTLAGYYQLRVEKFNLSMPQAQQTGKLLKRKSEELGYIVGNTHSERYGRVNTYHCFVLQAVLGF